ncbi:MAG: DUF2490 domain-containing protein [Sphingopyxis sp.]
MLAPVAARADDAQFWLTMASDAQLGPHTALTADIVVRSRPNTVDPAQTIARVGVRRDVGNGWNVQIAYALVETLVRGGPDRAEHRLSQTLSHPIGQWGGWQFDGRAGLEQRLRADGGAVGLRARARVRATHAIGHGLNAQLSQEVIGALNSTAWGQRAGISTTRTGAAVRVALSPRLGLSPGYTWQHVFVRAGADRNDHIAGLNIDAHF